MYPLGIQVKLYHQPMVPSKMFLGNFVTNLISSEHLLQIPKQMENLTVLLKIGAIFFWNSFIKMLVTFLLWCHSVVLSTAEHISVVWFHFPRGNLAVTKQVSFIVLTQPGSEPVWRQVWEKMLEKEKRRVGGAS